MVNLLLWNSFKKANPAIADMYVTVLSSYLAELNQSAIDKRDKKMCEKAHHYLEHLEMAGIFSRTQKNDLAGDLLKLVS